VPDAPAIDAPLVPPTPPDIPWLASGAPPIAPPVLTPCEAGWRQVPGIDGAPAHCDPYPDTGARTDCAPGEAHFPGEPSCARIGPACPADGWPAGTASLHVRAGSPSGGDGSRAAPFATIGEALAVGAAGTVIAIATGTYDEVLDVTAGVTLRGACVESTILTSSAPSDAAPVVRVAAPDVRAESLSIVSPERPGILVDGIGGPSSLTATGIEVSGPRSFGIRALGARATIAIDRAVVGDVRVRASDGLRGIALLAADGARAQWSRVIIHDASTAGAVVDDPGTFASLTASVIRDVSQVGGFAHGIEVSNGASLELDGVLVERVSIVGIHANAGGAQFVARDVVVREASQGIALSRSSRGTLSRAYLEGCTVDGIHLHEGTDRLDASDVVVQGPTQAGVQLLRREDGTGRVGTLALRRAWIGLTHDAITVSEASLVAADVVVHGATYALHATLQSDATVDRFLAERTTTGFDVQWTSAVVLTDVAVRGVFAPPPEPRTQAAGLSLADASSATVRRCLVEAVEFQGMGAADPGTTLDVADCVVRQLRPNGAGTGGRGISAEGGARVLLARTHIEGAFESGLFSNGLWHARDPEADGGISLMDLPDGSMTVVEARDLSVIDTHSVPGGKLPGSFGVGVGAQSSARIQLERARIERSRTAGLWVYDGAWLDGADVIVESSDVAECGDTCPFFTGGLGAAAYSAGARLSLTRFSIDESALCGVLVSEGGEVDITSGDVARAPIGACVQVPGYDVLRLARDVRYRDVGVSLQATSYSLPDELDR
jgi:hypothetical protein